MCVKGRFREIATVRLPLAAWRKRVRNSGEDQIRMEDEGRRKGEGRGRREEEGRMGEGGEESRQSSGEDQ